MDSTIEKGMRVLEFIVSSASPVRLSTVAKELQLQKSNAHRTINTLVALGYVTQDEDTGLYRPTLKLFEQGSQVIRLHPLRRAAAPYFQDLHRNLAETVNFCVLDDSTALVIDKLLSPRALRFTTQPGSRLPLAMTAAGRALLAYAEDPELLLRQSIAKMPPRPEAKLDPEKVIKSLTKIRKNGFAELKNGWTPGIFSIAVPLRGTDGVATAALGVSGPVERLTPENRKTIREALLTTSTRIAENMALI